MFFIRKGKGIIYDLRKKFIEKKQKQEALEKEKINLHKLPEKVKNSIKLNEIITF